jgi:hypothetical protein
LGVATLALRTSHFQTSSFRYFRWVVAISNTDAAVLVHYIPAIRNGLQHDLGVT